MAEHLNWPHPDRHFITERPDERIASALDSIRTRNQIATMFGSLFPTLLVVRPAVEVKPKQLSAPVIAQTIRTLGSEAVIGGFITEERATVNGLPAYPSLGIFGVRSFQEKDLLPAVRAYRSGGHKLHTEHPVVLLERLADHTAAVGMVRVYDRRRFGLDCNSTTIRY